MSPYYSNAVVPPIDAANSVISTSTFDGSIFSYSINFRVTYAVIVLVMEAISLLECSFFPQINLPLEASKITQVWAVIIGA